MIKKKGGWEGHGLMYSPFSSHHSGIEAAVKMSSTSHHSGIEAAVKMSSTSHHSGIEAAVKMSSTSHHSGIEAAVKMSSTSSFSLLLMSTLHYISESCGLTSTGFFNSVHPMNSTYLQPSVR